MTLPDKIILIGFRACGKTTVGRLLAERLGWNFVDTDREVVETSGATIAEIVAAHGWDAFREKEKKILTQLAGTRNNIIATGGGVVLHEDVWETFSADSITVWLQAPVAVIRSRLAGDEKTFDQRPPLTGNEANDEIASVLADRVPLYKKCSNLVISTEKKTPARITDEILASASIHLPTS